MMADGHDNELFNVTNQIDRLFLSASGPQKKFTRSVHYILLISLCMLLLTSCGAQLNAQTSAQTANTGPQANGQLTYVAIGASDTFGFGTSAPYTQNWATDLAVRLGPKYHLINLGIPSMLMHDALTAELPVALDAHPDLVTIWLAVNDIISKVPVDRYAQDLDTMLGRLQSESPHVRIVVANVPDLALLPYFYHQSGFDPQSLQAQILAYNTAVAAIVSHHHALLIDLSQRTYDIEHHPEYVSSDGLHPTVAGYAQLANLFYQALQAQG